MEFRTGEIQKGTEDSISKSYLKEDTSGLLAQEGAKQSPLELPVTPEETEKNKWTVKDSPQPVSAPFPLESVQPGLDSLSQGFRIQMPS